MSVLTAGQLMNQPNRECEIPAQMNRLSERIESVNVKLSSLVGRLSSVLHMSVTGAKQDKKVPQPELVPLAEAIRNAAMRIMEIEVFIDETINRLEL